MKKSVVIVVSIAFLLLLAFPRNALAFIPPEITAKYSANTPTIDGYLGSAEWNDTRKYEINLLNQTGDGVIEAWLYVKHNGTYIHIGILVWEIYTHALDEVIIAFDEGDDGSSGSGTRDFNLTLLQEDLKVCRSDDVLQDGYYNGTFYAKTDEIDFVANFTHETDHSTIPAEIEKWEGEDWVDDHWEAEFAIPFAGNDSGTSDVSDLSCNVTDTIGIKLQYYSTADNYYYPEGNLTDVGKYANLSFPAPTIESCNSTGDKMDNFTLYEDVYLNGTDFLPLTEYDLYIVDDVDVWNDSMAIPTRISGTVTSISSDSNGTISPTVIWSNASTVGVYDSIVDVNGNGLYDAGIDALDDNDIEVTAGFVIPEYSSFLILALFITAAVIITIAYKKISLTVHCSRLPTSPN